MVVLCPLPPVLGPGLDSVLHELFVGAKGTARGGYFLEQGGWLILLVREAVQGFLVGVHHF